MLASKRSAAKNPSTLKKSTSANMNTPPERLTPPVASTESEADATHEKRIAEAAYYRAAQRGFKPGHELDDWLCAEAEITGYSLQRTAISSELR